jgi:shikimate dehydrogenase
MLMSKNYRAQLTGVFGCPVDENPTIVLQEAAFRAAGLDFRYLTLLVRPEDLADAFRGLRAMNFRGINLTVPHKVEALKYVDELSQEVRLIGATNTIVNEAGKLVAYNTDGKGFVTGIQKRNVDLNGKRVTMLGAGGAARAIAVGVRAGRGQRDDPRQPRRRPRRGARGAPERKDRLPRGVRPVARHRIHSGVRHPDQRTVHRPLPRPRLSRHPL